MASLLLMSALLLGYVHPGVVAAQGELLPEVPTIVAYPSSIASTGDSITRAFNTGTVPFTDAPANSWSTGSNGSVASHYSRILYDHPPINGHAYNHAVTGAKMAGLNAQAQNAVAQGVEYVTILMGANDACTPTEAEMTPVATYRAQFQVALNTLTGGLPDARVYVLSVPDVYNLWYVLRDNASARFAWSFYGICQSMLANPQSNEPPDVERRNRVRQRVVDYNTQLAEVCATSIHCRFDGNAVFNTTFEASDVSTRDYFHPALQGHAKLAAVSYAAGYDFRDGVHPVSSAHSSRQASDTSLPRLKRPQGTSEVTITARDNIAVAGIEYRLNGGPYVRYTGPVSVPQGSILIYRAVDVNGNNEPARTFAP
jgi:lysophospholipase L1-like esterase